MKHRLADLLALALALAGFAAAAWTSTSVFDRLPHVEDEFANLWQAHALAEGHLYLASPPEAQAFLIPFVVDYEGRRFGKYPPGWPVTLAFGARLRAAWLVNPLLAGLSVWLVYRLGSRFGGRGVGVLAAGLTGVSPISLMLSGSFMSHTLSILLGLAFLLAWLDLFGDGAPPVPSWLLVLLAGSSLGLMALTRPLTAAAFALPFAGHALLMLVRRRPGAARQLLGIALLSLSLTALLPVWHYALTGHPNVNPYLLWWPYDRIGFGPGHGRLPGGHTLYQAYINTKFSLRTGRHDLFGWPSLSWIFVPFGIVGLRRQRGMWLLAALLPCLVLAYAAYWIVPWLYGPRYYVEALPALAVFSAAGMAWLAGLLLSSPGRWTARQLAAGVLVVCLLATNVLYYLPVRLGGMRGLYGVSRQLVAPFAAADLRGGLVVIRTAREWGECAAPATLTPPFEEHGFLVACRMSAQTAEQLAAAFPERRILLYDTRHPGEFRPFVR